MKKLTRVVLTCVCAVGLAGTFTACETDAPEINVSWSYISDWSKLVEAINNHTAEMTVKVQGLGDNLAAQLDANGKLIIDAIDKNGRNVAASITSGFEGANKVLGTVGDKLVVSIDKNTAAIVTLDQNTQKSFADLMATVQTENAKVILAIGEVAGQTKAVALAVDKNGNVIKAAISDAAELLNNTIIAQNTIISQKADKLATEIVNLSNSNANAIGSLKDQMKSSLASVENTTKNSIADLTTKTTAQLKDLGTKLAANTDTLSTNLNKINATITLGAADITQQIDASSKTIVSAINTKSDTIAAAIDRNTTATTNTGTGIKTAITTLDTNSANRLQDVLKALSNSSDSIQKTLFTLLDDKSALITCLNTQGEAVAKGIVGVQTRLDSLNNNITDLPELLKGQTDLVVAAINNHGDSVTTAIGALDANLQATLDSLKKAIEESGIIKGSASIIRDASGDFVGAYITAVGANGTVQKQLTVTLAEISSAVADALSDYDNTAADGIFAGNNTIANLTDDDVAKLNSLKAEAVKAGGKVVATEGSDGNVTVTAMDKNGATIGTALSLPSQTVAATIKNLKEVSSSTATSLVITHVNGSVSNADLTNIAKTVTTNAQIISNIYSKSDAINTLLRKIAKANGISGVIAPVEVASGIGKNNSGATDGYVALSISASIDHFTSSEMKEIAAELKALSDTYIWLSSADKLSTLYNELDAINTKLKTIHGGAAPAKRHR